MPIKKRYDLMKYSGCGGWVGKVGPGVLQEIVSTLPHQNNDKLICGFDNSEDAAVYELDKDNYLVTTLDFFSPNYYDPYVFGKIAAANSLSDIFAMGGDVMYSLNILAIPDDIESEAVSLMLKGAIDNVNEAGGVVVGGHTVSDDEIKYGLSVTGKVRKDKLMSNNNAKVNNKIILTKKVGTGIYGNEINEHPDRKDCIEVVESMATLNKTASEIMKNYNVTTCTDLTGFGIIGHLSEVAEASNVSIELIMDNIPLFDRTKELALTKKNGGMFRNQNHFRSISYTNKTNKEENINIVSDPQTSGGLFIFVDENDADALLNDLKSNGVEAASIIGQTIPKKDKHINIK